MWRHLRRNYLAHLAHGLLGQTGFRLIQAPTFIPAYLFALSGSDAWVGLARGAQSLGQCLTPLFGATLVEHRRRVLPLGLTIGGLMRLQVLGIALGGFWLGATTSNLLLVIGLLALFGFFMGMQGVAFGTLMAKVIPIERRGRLSGVRNALAGFTTAAVGVLGGRMIDENWLGNGYATTFLLAFALTAAGLCMLLFMREPVGWDVRERSRTGARMRELPALLRADPDFTWYFAARALASLGRMAMPFYVLYAGTRQTVTGTDLGLLSAAFVLATALSNLVWGWLGDRFGWRSVFLAALCVWIAATGLILEADGITALLAVFAGLGAGAGGYQIAGQTLVLEFGRPQDLPMRIAVANSTSELAAGAGSIAGGALALALGYPTLFGVAIACKVGAIAILLLRVREPRHRLRALESDD